MVLIPEEEGAEGEEDGEEGETSSSEGRDVGSQVEHLYCDLESIYEKYCERMLFFDRMSSQQLNVAGPMSPSTPSPRAGSRKLVSSFRCLSLKKMEEPDSDTEQLQQPDDSPFQDLETAYVAHICLTWEALHSQYTQLSQKISCQPENPTCYNHCAQQYQQFEVLLQRFIENEPFEQGSRVEKYARSRNSLSKLLQVPKVQGIYQNAVEDEESDYRILAPDLLKLIQTSILTFYSFLRLDKKKAGGVRNLFGSQNQMATPLQQVQSVSEKVLILASDSFFFSACMEGIQRVKTEGIAQEEELQKEGMAINTRRSNSAPKSHRCQSCVKGSKNGYDHKRSTALVRRQDEKTRSDTREAPQGSLSHSVSLLKACIAKDSILHHYVPTPFHPTLRICLFRFPSFEAQMRWRFCRMLHLVSSPSYVLPSL
uniref:Uncharacterized protein n=1 Tax=Chenopodium quinoa TaxID=63459 RepID=A0A803KQN0_CHEQI